MDKESNMKISVENYGPIAEAKDIEVGPLTVFVGPSNTGKSYLAILVYALSRCFYERQEEIFSSYSTSPQGIREISGYMKKSLFDESGDIHGHVKDALAKCPETPDFSDLPEELRDWISKCVARQQLEQFHEEISRCMGTTLRENDLTSGTFSVDFENERQKLTLQSLDRPPTMVRKGPWWFPVHLPFPREQQEDLSDETVRFLVLKLLRNTMDSLRPVLDPFYLPAGRTGAMQSHRAIAAAFVRRAPFATLDPVSIPSLSGILADFLATVIQVNTSEIQDDDIKQIAEKMETDILCGSINLKSHSDLYPQFSYKQNGLDVPLLRSSSMVSELAPVVIYLKHLVKKGDLLIIEEPEAHLHPEAQREVAKTIVRLVRQGVKVMVTTHSDYLLEQLENHVRVSKVSQEKRKALVGDADLYIEPDEINTYSFQHGERGTVVKKLPFDSEEGGLSPRDHNEISSALYNETVNILDEVERLQESRGEYKGPE